MATAAIVACGLRQAAATIKPRLFISNGRLEVEFPEPKPAMPPTTSTFPIRQSRCRIALAQSSRWAITDDFTWRAMAGR